MNKENKEKVKSNVCLIKDCDRPTHKESKYCIFHAKAEEKTEDEFKDKLSEYINKIKKKNKDYNFNSFIFVGDINFIEGFKFGTFKNASFDNATFEGNASFEDATFEGGTSFEKVIFGGYVSFIFSTFEGDVSFKETTFKINTKFNEATFEGNASFDKTIFRVETSFIGATFIGEASFDNATFMGNTDFLITTFEKFSIFLHTIFDGSVLFDEAIFNNSAFFNDTAFKGNATFEGATFKKNTPFNGVTFEKDVSFEKAIFKKNSYFEKVIFKGNNSFRYATFTGETYFDNAIFKINAIFYRVTFNKKTSFEKVVFEGYTSFDDATFEGNASFKEANIKKDISFLKASFNGNVDFSYSIIPHKRIFYLKVKNRGIVLLKKTFLANVILDVDLDREVSIDFTDALLRNTKIKSRQIENRILQEREKEFSQAREVFLLLKNNFHSIGRYDDESWAYTKERDMEKLSYSFTSSEENHRYQDASNMKNIFDKFVLRTKSFMKWFFSKIFLNWFKLTISSFIYGYGESPWKVIRFASIAIVLFALIFNKYGIITTSYKLNFLEEYLRKTESNGYILKYLGSVFGNFWNCLYFSVITFTTLGYGDFQPLEGWSRFFAGSEAFIGAFMMALFVYTFARRTGGR